MQKENKADQLYRRLRQRIALMRDGDTFPTVRQLMAEYGVSQSTVAPAVNMLKEKGLLEAFVGRGSFVRKAHHVKPRLLLLQNDWSSNTLYLMVEYIREAAEKAGFRFQHIGYDYQSDITQSLGNFEADVIVIDSLTNDLLTSEQALAIAQSPTPVILCRAEVPISGVNYVCGDNAASGTLIANYLYHMGHRKFGLLINEPHLRTVENIRRGFEVCAISNGCTIETLDCEIYPGERPHKQIAEFMKQYADGKYDFTCLVPVSSAGALMARESLEPLGVKVPQDLSIMSSGSIPLIPWLTTIDSSYREYCVAIMQMAHELVRRIPGQRQIELQQKILDAGSVRRLSPKATSKIREEINEIF